jgi:hypothetical protein
MASSSSPTAGQVVYSFAPTVPGPGTLSVGLDLPHYEVTLISFVVPPGSNGHLSWQILYSNEVVIPQGGGFIVTCDEKSTFELDELPTGGSWGFYGENTGTYDHTVYLRFSCDPLAGDLTLAELGLLDPLGFPAAGRPETSVLEPISVSSS